MALDLSEAPEGATHYGYGEHCPFWIKDYRPGVGYQFMNDSRSRQEWLVRLGDPEPKIYPIPSESRSPAWVGTGLPPVGVECEHHKLGGIVSDGAEWTRVKIIAHVTDDSRISPVAVYIPCDGNPPYVGQGTADAFRPVRTPEQIAAELRDRAIEELASEIAGWSNRRECESEVRGP